MSLPFFEIKSDTHNKIIHIVMRGFWTIETAQSYFLEKNKALDDMLVIGKTIDTIKVLIDTTEWEVQPRGVAELIDNAENKPVKTAVVNRSEILQRKQAQRIASDGYQFFLSKDEAMAWLLKD